MRLVTTTRTPRNEVHHDSSHDSLPASLLTPSHGIVEYSFVISDGVLLSKVSPEASTSQKVHMKFLNTDHEAMTN